MNFRKIYEANVNWTDFTYVEVLKTAEGKVSVAASYDDYNVKALADDFANFYSQEGSEDDDLYLFKVTDPEAMFTFKKYADGEQITDSYLADYVAGNKPLYKLDHYNTRPLRYFIEYNYFGQYNSWEDLNEDDPDEANEARESFRNLLLDKKLEFTRKYFLRWFKK